MRTYTKYPNELLFDENGDYLKFLTVIKNLLKANGMTQRDLTKKLNDEYNVDLSFERIRGRFYQARMSDVLLLKIADVFNVDPAHLVKSKLATRDVKYGVKYR